MSTGSEQNTMLLIGYFLKMKTKKTKNSLIWLVNITAIQKELSIDKVKLKTRVHFRYFESHTFYIITEKHDVHILFLY